LIKLFVLFVAVFSILLLFGHQETEMHTNLLRALLLTFLIFCFLVFQTVKKGTRLGERLVILPSLAPEPLPPGRQR
jgi:hypothetical protein